ncbi:Hpt domain-containing protein [Ancylomarina longa]|uniref:Hpt domain-containing protein n=2 Tax=Ancylomarina longa TaxID=2487017 RepID=A0A434AYP9_9BACT|nr:Hpt domain-containing protein [Ancylomarina longa]
MKHKPNILLVGFQNHLEIESMPNISFAKCQNKTQALEQLIEIDFDLIISKFTIENSSAIEFTEDLEGLKSYFAKIKNKHFKLLVLTSSQAEEVLCKDNKILFYPDSLDLESLITKLVDLPREVKQKLHQAAIIDFKELFIRVDNNREFIKGVMTKFFKVWKSRIEDIQTPLSKKEYNKAKDAAHKLKGVLANFSMQKARITIIDLEKLILDQDQDAAIFKLSELIDEIEKAKSFMEANQDLFKN